MHINLVMRLIKTIFNARFQNTTDDDFFEWSWQKLSFELRELKKSVNIKFCFFFYSLNWTKIIQIFYYIIFWQHFYY